MLSKKINITKFITSDEIENVKSYSKILSGCYNLCLISLRKKCNFNEATLYAKEFYHTQNELFSKHAQNTSREVINAIKSFFVLKKKDKTARFPSNLRYSYSPIILDINKQKVVSKKDNSIHYNICGGFKFLSEKSFQFNYPKFNLDLSKCKYFNPIEINFDTVKQIVITIENDKIWCNFIYSEKKKERKLNKEFISIDLGISSIASIYSSKGECFKYKTFRFKGLEKAKDELMSKLDRKKKKSKKWIKLNKILLRKRRKLYNKRKDYLHKKSKQIINYCLQNNIDNIIIGDIQTKKLVTEHKNHRNKSTQNEGLLSRFKNFIKYKAEINGLKVHLINEAYTSQENCLSGKRELSSDLSNRKVELENNFIIDRDLNSAINIAKKCRALWSAHSFNKLNLLNVTKINSCELDLII